MKTLREVYDTHRQRVREEIDLYINDLKNHIKDLGLGKRVDKLVDCITI